MKRKLRTLHDLEPDFRRVGVDSSEAFRELVNRNLSPGVNKVERGEPINIAVSVEKTQHVLVSLPDGAGTSAFVEAMIRSLQTSTPPRRRGTSDGAGA